ncbi:MAG: metal-sulfur cluster assembly factor [Gammaproteobacteria bacterium]|nr:metal-sulfur cluster assembly factor [Gammaproteobacteria bacterium]
MPTEAQILDALREVIDPELGYNIVDLGLIYGLALDGGTLKVTMTMTTRGCPAQDYIQDGVFRRAIQLDGVDDVDIELVWDPPWSPQKMSAVAKALFGIEDSAQP